MKALVIGANGMLGNAMVRVLAENKDWEVHGTLRSPTAKRFFDAGVASRLHEGVDVDQQDALIAIFDKIRPQLVVNCVGHVKQVESAEQPLHAIPINALLPHRLAQLCDLAGARLVHISTDCVFTGTRGGYRECDFPDALDLYGRTKLLGEVDYPHAITLRTSIIGHELESRHGLIEWFLSQEGSCKGYTKAIFSGLPTAVLASVIRDVVAPRPDLHGVYHLAAQPIAKYDLLRLVAQVYGKTIDIVPDDTLQLDRSLDGSRFRKVTGYVAPEWPELARTMHAYR
ncbi:SDR family oxidoreductase [Laribacter hongkongensis]|uniref:dTDP-4-dehydrorhamnose reductase family protein n=1 Tax=Laribacter hongkongensis TaxID=168471 RepID=UPI001EFCFC6E|nr:SDR family oxidoreductase [Laribacter hongkongensis]MCG8995477.1 SDR family oxidoreductase [Laribacter hongkongensis]MCG9010294.1 SDR family oxidoreductase [Laribacter hongkongensis]MCG9046188.1 SDR family oxidoreductase [Laribacter hongkongensis]MCG9051729.1 SDR family oxidoreductase [Laribacter hongkongensis]MCG9073760.1 SDR family oxidoreductase [Laribacter hongkongensis]